MTLAKPTDFFQKGGFIKRKAFKKSTAFPEIIFFTKKKGYQ